MKKFLLLALASATLSFMSCSKEEALENQPEKSIQMKTQEDLNPIILDSETSEYVKNAVSERIKTGVNYCQSCKCNVEAYVPSPGGGGVGVYHVSCSSGNQYEVVVGYDGQYTVYHGGAVVALP